MRFIGIHCSSVRKRLSLALPITIIANPLEQEIFLNSVKFQKRRKVRAFMLGVTWMDRILVPFKISFKLA